MHLYIQALEIFYCQGGKKNIFEKIFLENNPYVEITDNGLELKLQRFVIEIEIVRLYM